ncbi:MAG: molybdate ABC transporter substrate-binding protein [Pseudomonadales bacterium]
MLFIRRLAILLVITSLVSQARADQALFAVATNFRPVMDELVTHFEASSRHQIKFTTGSTGTLYAQVRSGAPFDALLAADERRPALLDGQGIAVPGSRFTYAIGQLALWSPHPRFVLDDGIAVLRAGEFRRLAMANPRVAPYGLAAQEVLATLGIAALLKDRIVQGENIGQTHAMIATGGAELGFTALSYVTSAGSSSGNTSHNTQTGTHWRVPTDLYSPIRQDAVLMARAKENTAARAFLAYLQSNQARQIIRAHGYLTDDEPPINPNGSINLKP